MSSRFILSICFVCICAFSVLRADEGMWTYDNPPIKQVEEKYGFKMTKDWLEKVRLGSVRFMDGGSGSFINDKGLVITNHHVARAQLQKMSSEKYDFLSKGFHAKNQSEEIKTIGMEVNILYDFQDVTARIKGAEAGSKSSQEALKARESEILKITTEAKEKTDLHPEVVSMYNGGEYWLYFYKKYNDIRLVFAPEQSVAFYGGDYDNFVYPRWDLDFTLFRVYENDKPVNPRSFFKFKIEGVTEGELTFVSGNPGRTSRLSTYETMEYVKEFENPISIKYYNNYIKILQEYSKLGTEQARQVQSKIFGIQNSLKVKLGLEAGFKDSEFMAQKRLEQDDFIKAIKSNSETAQEYLSQFEIIKSLNESKKIELNERYFGHIVSDILGYASSIVTYIEQKDKPDSERIDGYHQTEIDRTKFRLLSKSPLYKEQDLYFALAFFKQSLLFYKNSKSIQAILEMGDYEKVLTDAIENTQITDPEFRTKLIEGTEADLSKCSDPMIKIAMKIKPILEEEREWNRKNIRSVSSAATQKLAEARFKIYGKNKYPDANFTVRLSYGTAKGYEYNGTIAPYKTSLFGLFDRSASFDNKGDFALPEVYFKKLPELNLNTPCNFVSTNDIIGGNSGSPLINKDLQFVGIAFDGNIESLVGEYLYNMTSNRCVSLHPAYIIEALTKIYDAKSLVDEILN